MAYNIVMYRDLDGYPSVLRTANTLAEAERKKQYLQASIPVDAQNYVQIEEV